MSPRRHRWVTGSTREVTGGVRDRPGAAGAPEQRAQSGQQHDERERLGEVVVGAGVERLGVVVLAVLRRQHQDRCPVAAVAELLAHPVPVDAGQHDVEHDHVVRVLGGHPEPVGAGERHVDGEALGLQAAPHRPGDLLLVLDDEHAHRYQRAPSFLKTS